MPNGGVTIKCHGTQAHGSVCSWVGDNAIAKMVRILDALIEGNGLAGDGLVGSGLVSVESVSSGERASASSEYCEARIRCGEEGAKRIEALVASLGAKGVKGVEVSP
ncbi:MAG: peptidase dimerization domain-containing protein [Synergistaceae bacterium]|jgi:acetylornithine deacetylase/succinyl-diaminopimelate desuccinylase-like protein|nr:peptidase dimerization domain-containing protein [Synergistaceae bacterium]